MNTRPSIPTFGPIFLDEPSSYSLRFPVRIRKALRCLSRLSLAAPNRRRTFDRLDQVSIPHGPSEKMLADLGAVGKSYFKSAPSFCRYWTRRGRSMSAC